MRPGPLTGIWGESTVGGFWGAELKKTPFDGIILRGRASSPVYLLIEDDKVEIRHAADLWGLDTYETCEALANRHGKNVQVACIGPAGEKKVKIASVMVGGTVGRAAGRTGMGAVMGSKNLKAVALKGSSRPQIYSRDSLMERIRPQINIIKENAKGLTDFGTAGGLQAVEANGDLPIRNWSLGSYEEGAAKTCGQYIAATILAGHYACYACPIRCGKDVRIEMGPHKGTVASGPEYETAADFGANLLNDDINVIAAANDLCNRLGLDTISTSSAIAWAMESYENGLLTKEETGGLKITWGNGEIILELIQQIANRQGLGALLAEGVRYAANKIGGLAKEYAVETKGLEVAYHDPRAFTSMAVNYATANRGACHLEALTYFVEQGGFPLHLVGFNKEFHIHGAENKAEIAVLMQNYMEAFNDLGLCKFLIRGKIGPEVVASWISDVTGWNINATDVMRVGERNFNLKRVFNYRLGITRKDDYLSPRLAIHDKKTGRAAGSIPHLGKMLVDYYKLRGWSEEGIPKKEKLAQLDLVDVL